MNVNIQDRTYEFQQAVTNFARQNQQKSGNIDSSNKNTQTTNNYDNSKNGEFNKQASHISKEIVSVTSSLKKLAQLAKRKQLYGDKPTDIVELTYLIKQDIFKIEKELKNLKNLQIGNSNSNKDSQVTTYNKNVVQLLNTKTKNISENFREVLQTRQKNEMIQRNRQEQLLATVKSSMQGNVNENLVPYAVRNANGSNDITNNSNNNNSNNNNNISDNPFLANLDLDIGNNINNNDDINDISKGNFNSLSLPDQNQQLMLLEEQNNQYIQERSNAVEAIESTINEVGGLFQQLATMVQEQGEVIQRIDDNVEDVSLNISGAQRELMKYYNSVSSNRWLMLKIFGVLIVFFLLWVLIS